MKTLLSTAISSFIGLTIGNILWQLLMASVPQWSVAAERSFFQFVAMALLVGLMAPKMRKL